MQPYKITHKKIVSLTKFEKTKFYFLVNKHCHMSGIPEVDKKARKKLIIASILCVIFMIAEIVGEHDLNVIF